MRIKNLSVLMTTYNCGHYISQAITSIIKQTYKNFELIIIDDGSVDDTKEVINQFNDSRIVYINKEHSGFSDSLNFGLNKARSEWIARMDADDISLPQRLEKQVNFLNNNSKYNIISSWYAVFNTDKVRHLFNLPQEHLEIISALRLHSPLCHGSSLYNKKLIVDCGGYFNVPFGTDYNLWLRLGKKAIFYNIPEILILVRARKNSLHRNLNMDTSAILLMQRKYFPAGTSNPISKSQQKENSQIEGWREWFYGSKKESRKYWMKNYSIFKDLKIFLAFILSFLPSKLFKFIKQLNIKARIHYLRLSKENKKELNSFISSQSYK
ncbi:MAG: glycosyltransferase [Ignavibacteriaceae bacterium]|nr:glycosyltransferase [Ignavibacteriaceae bacterium]